VSAFKKEERMVLPSNREQAMERIRTSEALEEDLTVLKAAFDDRVKIIELQLKDKKELAEALKEAAEIDGSICDRFKRIYLKLANKHLNC